MKQKKSVQAFNTPPCPSFRNHLAPDGMVQVLHDAAHHLPRLLDIHRLDRVAQLELSVLDHLSHVCQVLLLRGRVHAPRELLRLLPRDRRAAQRLARLLYVHDDRGGDAVLPLALALILGLEDVDGVPVARVELVLVAEAFVDEPAACEVIVFQVPEINGGDAAAEVPF